MRTKPTAWLDTSRNVPVYGIAVKNKDGKWCHVAKKKEDGRYEIEKYDSKEERDKRRAELRKEKFD